MGGGGGETSSSSNQSTTTNQQDKRIANQSGMVLSNENSNANVTVNSLDSTITGQAFDFAKVADASNGEGFSKLLGLAEKTITSLSNSMNKSQDSIFNTVGKSQDAVLGALQTVQNDQKGAVDQKTMIVLASAAAVTIVAMNRKRA